MSAPAKDVTMLTTFGEVAPRLEVRDFDPISTKPRSKAPAVDGWQHGGPIARWLPRCARCGAALLTRRTPAVDVAVQHGQAADGPDRLEVDQLGDGSLHFGQPRKRLRLCRTEAAFPSIASGDLL